MTRFLNGPVVAMFLAAACALTAYVIVTGAQTAPQRVRSSKVEQGPFKPMVRVRFSPHPSERAAFEGRRADAATPPAIRKDAGTARSVNVEVAYHRRYPVDWRRRYHAEHAHVQRLLHQLHHTRSPQAVATPPHYDAWLCIHRYEGAWDANTGNGFFGGLQMDMGFQRAYGAALLDAKGTADHWTPLEQMWAAERAYRSGRGYTPWPNTARMCGLL